MQASKARSLREQWKRDGGQPCEHERSEREYDLGADTGDAVCLNCGTTWWRNGPKPGPLAAGEE